MGSVPSGFEAVDDAIRAGADGAFSFLERLIGARSTVGEEAPAQRQASRTGMFPGRRGLVSPRHPRYVVFTASRKRPTDRSHMSRRPSSARQ